MGLPPEAPGFGLADVEGLDDEALRTFLRPGEQGVEPDRLGTALSGSEHDALARRILRALPEQAAAVVRAARSSGARPSAVEGARAHVLERLFWPLVYWHRPQEYEELVSGEEIHPALVSTLQADGLDVADLGCGAGRLTLALAPGAARLVAVDAVPALLARLRRSCERAGVDNVELRRGDFERLPVEDASVDLAVACSSLTSRAPFGGDAGVAEATRITRPGGRVVVIWPDDPAWFTARGFTYVVMPGPMAVRFGSVEAAVRLCAQYHSAESAAWCRRTQSAVVPYDVLGVPAPRDACVLTVSGGAGLDPTAVLTVPTNRGIRIPAPADRASGAGHDGAHRDQGRDQQAQTEGQCLPPRLAGR